MAVGRFWPVFATLVIQLPKPIFPLISILFLHELEHWMEWNGMETKLSIPGFEPRPSQFWDICANHNHWTDTTATCKKLLKMEKWAGKTRWVTEWGLKSKAECKNLIRLVYFGNMNKLFWRMPLNYVSCSASPNVRGLSVLIWDNWLKWFRLCRTI